MTSVPDWDALGDAARQASARAYSPYSEFPVGAAVQADDGRIFAGCNVENASSGLTVCAERNAVAQAVLAGARQLVAVAVYTPTASPTPPCGACRQVLAEFGLQASIRCACDGAQMLESSVAALLPGAFVLPPG